MAWTCQHRKQTVSCKSLLTGGLWKIKRQCCVCEQASKAQPDFCVCEKVCVWHNNRRFVCGLITAQDNIGWQVCTDQTLHRQSPARALSYVSLCYLSTSNTPTLPPPFCGLFWEIMAYSAAGIVLALLCEVRMSFCAPCLFLHAQCSAIYRMALQARCRWSEDPPWIVSAQKRASM